MASFIPGEQRWSLSYCHSQPRTASPEERREAGCQPASPCLCLGREPSRASRAAFVLGLAVLIPVGNYRLSLLLCPEVPGARLHNLPAVMRDLRPLIFLSEAEMRRSLSAGWSTPELRLVKMRNIPPTRLSPALREPLASEQPRPPSPRCPPVSILGSDLPAHTKPHC